MLNIYPDSVGIRVVIDRSGNRIKMSPHSRIRPRPGIPIIFGSPALIAIAAEIV
jgi:hypothetical protein